MTGGRFKYPLLTHSQIPNGLAGLSVQGGCLWGQDCPNKSHGFLKLRKNIIILIQ